MIRTPDAHTEWEAGSLADTIPDMNWLITDGPHEPPFSVDVVEMPSLPAVTAA